MLAERDAKIRELEETVRMLKEKLTACEIPAESDESGKEVVDESPMENIIEENVLEEE